MPEARIRTEFGDIRFSYGDASKLDELLKEVTAQAATIAKHAAPLLPKPPRPAKPGYEHAYRFTPSGSVELLHFPNAKTKLVGLALFAYHPEMVDAETVQRVTGVDNVEGVVLNQTANKKYFRREGDLYGLTPEGIQLAVESVPQVQAPPPEPGEE
jgi:hypothetical protein